MAVGRRLTLLFFSGSSMVLLAPGVAGAQGETVTEQELITPVGITHGISQGTAVFLAGLVAFAALVWIPVSRSHGNERDAGSLFSCGAWFLLGLLVLAGLAEMSLFVVRAAGESLSLRLLWEALTETRTGSIWLVRLGLGFLTALAASWAASKRQPLGWWVATLTGSALLITLAQQSHAAAEGGIALLASWLHVVGAAFWMGGLLGFPVVLLGPLRSLEPDERLKVRTQMVRRFSRVATGAVLVIVATGIYATLAQIPSVAGLVGTSYGRALIMKLGLMLLLLATGGINFIDKGRGPFGRMVGAELVLAIGIFIAAGFLTSLPPAEAVLEYGVPRD